MSWNANKCMFKFASIWRYLLTYKEMWLCWVIKSIFLYKGVMEANRVLLPSLELQHHGFNAELRLLHVFCMFSHCSWTNMLVGILSVYVWTHSALWWTDAPFIIKTNVPGIGSGSSFALTRIKQTLKMKIYILPV